MLQANNEPKARVLILDEDRIILQSLSQFLRRDGYEARTTDDVEDAIALLESGQFELLLADVSIAGLKPTEFLRDVRRRFPQVVVVVVTSYGSIEGAVEATKMGAFDYLTKPIVDDEIRVVVEKAVRQQSLLFENQTLKQQLGLAGLEDADGIIRRIGGAHVVSLAAKKLRERLQDDAVLVEDQQAGLGGRVGLQHHGAVIGR